MLNAAKINIMIRKYKIILKPSIIKKHHPRKIQGKAYNLGFNKTKFLKTCKKKCRLQNKN